MASKTRARPSQVAAGDEAVSGEEREELWLPWGRMGSLNAGVGVPAVGEAELTRSPRVS